MNISYNWLKKYIDLDLEIDKLNEILTFSGIEVEKISEQGEELKPIIIGEVLKAVKHPNADKLKKCLVFDGKNELEIVCGAPNCRVGLKVALAPIGAKIGDFKIKKSKIRGEFSSGMLCSEKELGLSDKHDGIIELPSDAKVGSSLRDYFAKNDTIFEVEITPNRPDLLGTYEVARDIAATLDLEIMKIDLYDGVDQNKISNLTLLNNEPDLCPRYTAKLIRNVKIKKSPQWIQDYLISVGIKPINNIVDITNFVMYEFGHPLHAFDYDKINGKKIIVRKSNDSEEISALDGKQYKLDNDLVIADEKEAIAIAGIIGGTNSQIDENTKNVILETANFDFKTIRNSSKKHKIFTDSAYRFERNLSSEKVDLVRKRALNLIEEIVDCKIIDGCLDSNNASFVQKMIDLRISRVKLLTTLDLTSQQINRYLTRLGLELFKEKEDLLRYRIPYWRKDLEREVDLIEEILRLHGFDKVKRKLVDQPIMNRKMFSLKRNIEDIFVSNGFYEVINSSFDCMNDLKKLNFFNEKEIISLLNPMGENQAILRNSLLASIMRNIGTNLKKTNEFIRIFELSKVYKKNSENQAEESFRISGGICGLSKKTSWGNDSNEAGFFDLKGVLENLFNNIDLAGLKYDYSEKELFQNGVAADLFVGKDCLGSFGKVDPRIAQKFEIEKNVFIFELDLDKLAKYSSSKKKFKEIPKFPSIKRDLSFLVTKSVNFNDIEKVIFKANRKIINSINLFDVYEGKNIPENQKSLSISIVFQSQEKTLKEKNINKIMEKIIKQLEKKFSIEMR